jgi:hypothetical protein
LSTCESHSHIRECDIAPTRPQPMRTHTLAVDVKNEILSEHKKVHVLEQHRADSAWLSACFVRAGIDKKLIMRSGQKDHFHARCSFPAARRDEDVHRRIDWTQ